MNEQMLRDQIAQLETDNRILREQKERFEKFYHFCLGIHHYQQTNNLHGACGVLCDIERLFQQEKQD